jgi:acetyl-CoA carboxylase biotin carboxyl carrier protein
VRTIVPLDANELREILLTLNQTDISELTLKQGDFELVVRRGVAASAPGLVVTEMMQGTPLLATTPQQQPAAAPPLAHNVAPSTSAPPTDKKYLEVVSPIVGTFYSAPAPDEPAFVRVGDRISKGQTVCIIEAMKIMNEIEAEISGEVVEVLVDNGQPVEYGQPLLRVNPG